MAWVKRLQKVAPISSVAVETVRFDTQTMLKPETGGVEYQQGELAGYKVREYLLEKFGKQCVYCRGKNIPHQIEDVQAKSRGGSDRVSNLDIVCSDCNTAKGNMDMREFLAGKPDVLRKAPCATQSPAQGCGGDQRHPGTLLGMRSRPWACRFPSGPGQVLTVLKATCFTGGQLTNANLEFSSHAQRD